MGRLSPRPPLAPTATFAERSKRAREQRLEAIGMFVALVPGAACLIVIGALAACAP